MRTEQALEAIAAEIRQADRFLLTTHEGPDGDALGSMLGLHELLGQLGKDSVMFLPAKEFPLPVEYRFLPLTDIFFDPPADVLDRTLIFLDCGNIDRMPVEFLQRPEARRLNLDHHHDNTLFGDVNLVDVEASCTAQIVWELAKRLEVPLTPRAAGALYVGLVTDTGKFMYENTDIEAHRMAAELIEVGVDVSDIYRRLYERVPPEKLRLLARALSKVERFDDGRLSVAYVTEEDYLATGASEDLTEGIIDHLRSIEGTRVAAFVRDKAEGGRSARKVSLRSSDGAVDVSIIARAHGGGGHARAAGFGTDLTISELVTDLRRQLDSSTGSNGNGAAPPEA
ncbi:MAG: bifunctional oligoribonuclease/PAP phosphatase NrnA [Solirubrobacterales bacterium]|nr:bifunctional oligoribonuclease/PAP phosphatase NrnA [Solirubrobacterales bacterium]